MNPSEFILFGSTHILTLIFIFGISFGFSFYIKDSYDSSKYSTFESTLGYLLIFNELLKPFYLIELGKELIGGPIPSLYMLAIFLLMQQAYFFLQELKNVLILHTSGVLEEELWLCLHQI